MRRLWWVPLCWSLCGPALAWGDDGHRIIALIADHHLKPAVRAQVRAWLDGDTSGLTDTSLPEQATWADKYRDSDRGTTRVRFEQTREWHYVNVALADGDLRAACHGHPTLPEGTLASAGPARACIVDKIGQFIAELRDPVMPAAERRLALQFLLHLMGDVHQPLHVADDRDRGGNDKPVARPAFDPGNLHQLWDTGLVRRLGDTPESTARALIRRIGPSQRKAWSAGTPTDWARESFQVGKSLAYGRLPAPGADGVRQLGRPYLADATGAVSLQLRKAGLRLALVLNTALRHSAVSGPLAVGPSLSLRAQPPRR